MQFSLFPPTEAGDSHFSVEQTSLPQPRVQLHDAQAYKVLFPHVTYRNIYMDRQTSPVYT